MKGPVTFAIMSNSKRESEAPVEMFQRVGQLGAKQMNFAFKLADAGFNRNPNQYDG